MSELHWERNQFCLVCPSLTVKQRDFCTFVWPCWGISFGRRLRLLPVGLSLGRLRWLRILDKCCSDGRNRLGPVYVGLTKIVTAAYHAVELHSATEYASPYYSRT